MSEEPCSPKNDDLNSSISDSKKIAVDTSKRLMNMSMHGSMIANFLIKKANNDVE